MKGNNIMKKKIISCAALAVTALSICLLSTGCTGCGNKTFFDTTYTYEYAMISLPNGETVEGKVKEWSDYEDGDQLQIKFENGNTYLVHSEDCALMVNEPN